MLFAPLASGAGPRRGWSGALVAAAITSAGGVALLLYNRARFGSILDFGLHYALFGEDYRGIKYSNIGFIPFNLWTYLFSAPQAGPYFPFLHPFWTDDRPAGFIGFEEVYGVVFMLPVHVAAFAALGWAWAARSVASARPVVLTLLAGVLATVFAGFILFSWAWACSRFITELMAGWSVVSAVGLMVIFGSGAGRLTRVLAALAACWTVSSTWLASAEFRGFMRQTNPAVYSAAAHALDYPSLWWARAHNIAYGPVDLSLRVPPGAASPTAVLGSGRPQSDNRLEIVPGAGGTRARFTQNERLILETPALPESGGLIGLHVEAPWLYPPAEHPYWDSVGDASHKRDLQTRFSIEWQGAGRTIHSIHSADAVAFSPAVLDAASAAAGQPAVESLKPAPASP
jgi:hypothetical protein